jgi:hypothetical protein
MRTLLSVLAVGLLVLVAAPQNALACHQDAPHGNEVSCDGGGGTEPPVYRFVGWTDVTFVVSGSDPATTDTLADVVVECQTKFTGTAKAATVAEYYGSPDMTPPVTAIGALLGDNGGLHLVGRVTGVVTGGVSSVGGNLFGCSEPW